MTKPIAYIAIAATRAAPQLIPAARMVPSPCYAGAIIPHWTSGSNGVSRARMTAHKPGDPTTLNRLYGRSKGKPLRKGQQALVDELLPRIAVPAEGPVTAERLFG